MASTWTAVRPARARESSTADATGADLAGRDVLALRALVDGLAVRGLHRDPSVRIERLPVGVRRRPLPVDAPDLLRGPHHDESAAPVAPQLGRDVRLVHRHVDISAGA